MSEDYEEFSIDIEDITNSFGQEHTTDSVECPYFDEKLINYLKTVFTYELSFSRTTTLEEYQFKTGVVEVIQLLIDENNKKNREV